MKASLTEYIKQLSGNELSILEEIISKKYRKFINFFSLVQDISDDIISLKYNFTDDSTLDIELGLKKSVSKDMKDDIFKELELSGYKIEMKKSNKKLKMIIIYDESEMI